MARSFPTFAQYCRSGCSSFPKWLDFSLWHPSTIVTNCGHQFKSELWHTLMSLLGSMRACTTVYHLQTNSMIERFHRQLKAALKAQPNPHSWMDTLSLVLLGIRTSLKEDISVTAAEMVYVRLFDSQENFSSPHQ